MHGNFFHRIFPGIECHGHIDLVCRLHQFPEQFFLDRSKTGKTIQCDHAVF